MLATYLEAATEGKFPCTRQDLTFHIAAKRAGAIILEAFNDRQIRGETEFKTSAADVVTKTDRAVEAFVFGYMRKQFPEHSFIGEESYGGEGQESSLGDGLTWIVDPVDGTTNFVHGFPFVAVSIALVEKKVPIVGVVFNPILNELFTASKGNGAFMNGRRLPLFKPIALESLDTALLATEYGYDRDERMDKKLAGIRKALSLPSRGIRSIGSAALEACYVARGALDAYWEGGVHAWDVAAAAIIVRESGGAAINFRSVNGETDVNKEVLDLQSREFVFVRAMPDGDAGVNRVAKIIRGCIEPLAYQRD
ncbi:Inositol monophosphatase 1 [Phlyctochytrium planicorne]|nr:Inositol monophosphatase 1 [Phlyctochytrium planicorne]